MENLQEQINKLKLEIDLLKNSTTIPFEVDGAFRERFLPDHFERAPLEAITAPSGGVTVDSNARTAINSIITAMEDLGLLKPN